MIQGNSRTTSQSVMSKMLAMDWACWNLLLTRKRILQNEDKSIQQWFGTNILQDS